MLVTVAIIDDLDSVHHLIEWFRRDDGLRGTVVRSTSIAPGPEDMGGLASGLEVLGQSKELLAAVATTLGVWLGTRVRRTRIRVKHGDREVEIDTGKLKDPAEIAQEIVRQLGDDHGD